MGHCLCAAFLWQAWQTSLHYQIQEHARIELKTAFKKNVKSKNFDQLSNR